MVQIPLHNNHKLKTKLLKLMRLKGCNNALIAECSALFDKSAANE